MPLPSNCTYLTQICVSWPVAGKRKYPFDHRNSCRMLRSIATTNVIMIAFISGDCPNHRRFSTNSDVYFDTGKQQLSKWEYAMELQNSRLFISDLNSYLIIYLAFEHLLVVYLCPSFSRKLSAVSLNHDFTVSLVEWRLHRRAPIRHRRLGGGNNHPASGL